MDLCAPPCKAMAAWVAFYPGGAEPRPLCHLHASIAQRDAAASGVRVAIRPLDVLGTAAIRKARPSE